MQYLSRACARVSFAAACALTAFPPTMALAQTVSFVNIANSTTTNGGAFSGFGAPSINTSGTVAFRADLDAGGSGIFTNTAGNSTAALIANTTTTNSGAFSNIFFPSINDAGTVAFGASLNAGGFGIFTNTAGSSTAATVADTTTTNGGAFSLFSFVGINASGTAAFEADLDAGGTGIFTNTAGSGTASLIADTTTTNNGAFSDLSLANINSLGTVAFRADLDAGGLGIFAALSGSNAPFKVVQTGDSLFGSTVSSLAFLTNGLNDSNQVAFRYSLTDGREGVAVASISAVTVPEANTFALALPALGLVALCNRVGAVIVRRRKK